MSTRNLTQLLAAHQHTSEGAAADTLDKAVSHIVRKLKQGKPALLPGVGKFTPGATVKFQFDRSLPKSPAPPAKGGRRGKR